MHKPIIFGPGLFTKLKLKYMRPASIKWICAVLFLFLLGACRMNGSSVPADTTTTDTTTEIPSIKTADILYKADSLQCHGFIAYDENRKGKLPVVVVVHEWWGLTDYPKSRARQLAALGYFALDADMFGEGRVASTPAEAMAFTKPYYTNPALAKSRLDAAIEEAKTFPQADTSRIAAIGYCFGGYIVLNAAKLGSPLAGTVSFHGDLSGVAPQKGVIHGDILVCQGGDDSFVPENVRSAFKKSMDSVGAHYTFIKYTGAVHAFTNPEATALGKKFNLPIAYNAAADSASWSDMKLFLESVFKK
jgi:dienelactone hydrolase